MFNLVVGAFLGSSALAVTHLLRTAFQEGEAIETVAGLAYLRVLAAEHDTLPPEARPDHIRDAADPAAAVASAVAALESSDALQGEGALLRALGLPARAAVLSADNLHALLDAITLDADAEASLSAVESSLSAAMVGPGRFRRGDYYTASRVVDLVSRLLAPTPGSRVYDPTCGTASLLLGALDFATAKGGAPPQLVGQDLNPTAVALSRVRCHLRGAPASVALGDVLRSPANTDGDRLSTFDFVVSNPPRGLPLDPADLAADPYGRFPEGLGTARSADAAFLLHAVASLGPSGRAVLTTTPELLQSGAFAAVRRYLVEADLVEAVVSLPAAFFQNGSTSAPPLLVLNRAKPPALAGHTVFVEAETGVVPDHVLVDRIAAVAGQSKPQRGLSAVKTTAEVSAHGWDLSPSAYVPLVQVERFMGGGGRRIPLSQFAEIRPGRHVNGSQGGSEPVIRARDVRDRVLVLDELDRMSVEGDRSALLVCQPGDVVLQRVGTQLAAAAVPDNLGGALASQSVIVVRPSPADPAVTGYLVDLLNADLGQTLLKTASSWMNGARAVRPSTLRDLSVPVPDDVVLALLADVRRTEADLVRRSESARALRERLFALDDPEAFDDEVRRLRAEAEVFARGLGEADSLAYRVRNFYPFPLAYRYRELDGIADVRARHQALLDVAENTLAFLGSLGLSLATQCGALSADDLAQSRSGWQGGMTIGNWQSLAYQAAKAVRKHPGPVSPAAADFAAAWFQGRGQKTSDFFDTVGRIVGLRNDVHHGRGPTTDAEFENACGALKTELDEAFGSFGWMVAYPLRLVERVDARWGTTSLDAETLRYTGDHPALQRETVSTPTHLVTGHLYIEAGGGPPLSLYPLVTVQACPACKRRETYYVDYWNGPGDKTKLKSFERSGGDHQLAADSVDARRVSTDLDLWFAAAAL